MAEVLISDGWTVFDQAPIALGLTDRDGVVVRVNGALCEVLGYSAGELVGSDGFALISPGDRAAALCRVAALIDAGEPYEVDHLFTDAHGDEQWRRASVGCVTDGEGRRLLLAHIEDTTEERHSTARLRELAERDHLTGLLNRRRLEEEVEAALAGARRHGHESTLVVIDLDHFKAVNDRGGHEAGDRALCLVASTVLSRVRTDDVVARLGGDEFAVLLRNTGVAPAERVAAELVRSFAARSEGVTMSVGVAALTPATRNARAALHAADLAMYAAKSAGGGQALVHTPGDMAAGEAALREAAATRRMLGALDGVAACPSVENTLAATRELLGMDVSWVTMMGDTELTVMRTGGDGAPFGVHAGMRVPLGETYCHRIQAGELPAAMPDVRAIPEAATMSMTEAAGIGAFASVPIHRPDGRLYGTLCAASQRRVPGLGTRDTQFLAVLARLVAAELDREPVPAEDRAPVEHG